ncbi:MAG: hypothetical protein JNK21_02990 [Rhodospirillaceae bacterium]|nr:hypothetical protein [Rhodospirillaceae bacterium]
MSQSEPVLTLFFRELKRRGVIRIGLAYLVTGWALTEPVSSVIQVFQLPPWLLTAGFIVFLSGFPIAVIIAWLFKIKDGVIYFTATLDALPDAPQPHAGKFHRRLTIYTVVMVMLAVGLFLGGLFFRDMSEPKDAGINQTAIAVLPFADMSPERNQGYFAEGVAEEILNLLARDSNLSVVGRTSAWVFKDRPDDFASIRDILKVSHVLEGGVRTAGGVVRITVRLIETATGHNVWSEEFTRPMTDIFALQDEIGGIVVRRLKGTFVPAQAAAAVSADEAHAYELMLEARQKMRIRTVPELDAARASLKQASLLAPNNPQILTMLAEAHLMLSNGAIFYGTEPYAVAKAEALRLLQKAQSIDPDDAGSYYILALAEPSTAGAIRYLQRAIEIDAKALQAINMLGIMYMDEAELVKALDAFMRVTAIDPLYPASNVNIAYTYSAMGLHDKADAVMPPLIKGVGPLPLVRSSTNLLLLLRGDLAGAMSEARKMASEVAGSMRNQTVIQTVAFLLGDRAAAISLSNSAVEQAVMSGALDNAVELSRGSFASHDRVQRADMHLVGDALVRAGRHDEFLALLGPVEAEAFADIMAGDFSVAGPALAIALRRAGREAEVTSLISVMRKRLDRVDAAGIPEPCRAVLWARLFAIEGNHAEALKRLEWALDNGWKGQLNWADSAYYYMSAVSIDPADFPEFEPLRKDAEFLRIRAKFWAAVNAERAKLAMAPVVVPPL